MHTWQLTSAAGTDLGRSACHALKPARSSLSSDCVAEQLEDTTLTHILEQDSCGLKEWLMTPAADASPEVRGSAAFVHGWAQNRLASLCLTSPFMQMSIC